MDTTGVGSNFAQQGVTDEQLTNKWLEEYSLYYNRKLHFFDSSIIRWFSQIHNGIWETDLYSQLHSRVERWSGQDDSLYSIQRRNHFPLYTWSTELIWARMSNFNKLQDNSRSYLLTESKTSIKFSKFPSPSIIYHNVLWLYKVLPSSLTLTNQLFNKLQPPITGLHLLARLFPARVF